MERFKLNGQSFSMPTGWHEVSYSNAMEIISKEMRPDEIFSLLSGVPLDVCRNAEDPTVIEYFMSAFNFIREMPNPKDGQIPLSMKLGDEILPNPITVYDDLEDLGKLNMGQIGDMSEYLKKTMLELKGDNEDEDWMPSPTDMLEIMPDLVAIYVQKIMDNEYDYAKARKLVDRVRDEMPFKDVTNMGYFFLQKSTDYLNGSTTFAQRRNWMQRRLRRAYQSLMKGLASTRL